MNKLFSGLKYFSIGLQLISLVIIPLIVSIMLGLYIQKKFNLGEWVILLSIGLGIIIMISDIYSFSKKILKNLQKDSEGEKHAK